MLPGTGPVQPAPPVKWNPLMVGLGAGGSGAWTTGASADQGAGPSSGRGVGTPFNPVMGQPNYKQSISRSYTPTPPSGSMVGSGLVQATGSGPYDPAYRQNLAAYAGGQLYNPTGVMQFNPTNFSTYPGGMTGGGTAPLPGMPTTLLQQAMGGQPFSYAPPTQAANTLNQWSPWAHIGGGGGWLENWLRQGGGNGLIGGGMMGPGQQPSL